MAKIDEIKLNIDGVVKKYNINVGKEGIFRCKIDYHIAKKIGLENGSLEFTTLSDLETLVYTKYNEYIDSKKEYAVFIGIEYQASGNFAQKANGHFMFGQYDKEKPYYDTNTRFSIASSLLFGYKFYIREQSSTGQTLWYKAEKVDADYEPRTFEKIHEGFVFNNATHSTYGKLIPYSEKAEQTLSKAKEGLRQISEILFNFINQDEKLIEATLLNGNLLKE